MPTSPVQASIWPVVAYYIIRGYNYVQTSELSRISYHKIIATVNNPAFQDYLKTKVDKLDDIILEEVRSKLLLQLGTAADAIDEILRDENSPKKLKLEAANSVYKNFKLFDYNRPIEMNRPKTYEELMETATRVEPQALLSGDKEDDNVDTESDQASGSIDEDC